jgi:hypothetical protein
LTHFRQVGGFIRLFDASEAVKFIPFDILGGDVGNDARGGSNSVVLRVRPSSSKYAPGVSMPLR